MSKSLEHLPKHKREELDVIRDIILEVIPDVRMIILFGSYARGTWVEDTHIEEHVTHVYESDYDILVATKTAGQAENVTLHHNIEKAIEATGKVKTPVSIIYHSFGEVKERITEGHYFFADIKEEGIHLYKTGKHHLGKAKILSTEERKQLAQEYFEQWLKNANGFYRQHEHAVDDGEYKIAAFNLHQTTESLYSAITLVFINYRFRTHDLELLNHKAISYDAEFGTAFPMETEQQRENFQLLKRAYIDARYKKDYVITKDQLEYLAQRVKVLRDMTAKLCMKKIDNLKTEIRN